MKKSNGKNNNMSIIIVVSCIALLLGVVAFVVIARKEMFESKPVLSYYYLPTCGWCTKFNPEWEKFVKIAPATISTQKVDGTSSPDIEKYKIKSFPHIQLVKGDKVKIFEGERTSDNLMKFVTDNASM
jgi:thioredoxin-like negative regulator of GroEL